jgi:hypothetical protein
MCADCIEILVNDLPTSGRVIGKGGVFLLLDPIRRVAMMLFCPVRAGPGEERDKYSRLNRKHGDGYIVGEMMYSRSILRDTVYLVTVNAV